MDHHTSWFSFLPGFAEASHWAHGLQGVLFSRPGQIQHVFAGALVCLALLALSLRARMQLQAAGKEAVIPDPKPSIRNLLEVFLEAIYKQGRAIIGKEIDRYFPVIATLALFILFSNLLGLIPGFLPPTDNWNTTMACGGFVFFYYNYHGFRANGMRHLEHMANPVGEAWGWFLAPLLFVIELFSHGFRPLTLGLRLSANMIADHNVLSAFLDLAPWLVPIIFLFLGTLVSVVQTMVFVLLTMTYIGMATAHTDHDHEEESDDKASVAATGAGAHA